MDIIFSAVLIAFSTYCFFLVGAESPAPTATELGAAFWPRIILTLMIILLTTNIVKQLKAAKTADGPLVDTTIISGFFKSKLLVGMIFVIIMAVSMPYIGFSTSCFIFLVAYAALLGEKKLPKAVINSLVITVILYIVFQGLLDIRLERGVGVFRDLALSLEGIILNIKRGL